MHLRSTATEQVNKSWVEGHDGVPHVNDIIIAVLDNISITGHNNNNQKPAMTWYYLSRIINIYYWWPLQIEANVYRFFCCLLQLLPLILDLQYF